MDGDETGGREVIKVDDGLGPAVVVPVTGIGVEFTEGALRFLVDASWGATIVGFVVVAVGVSG
jgi:hypothetical protein